MISKAEKIYREAHEKYDRAEALIKEMSGDMGEAFFREAMKNFDIVLQCILYRAAIVDDKYARSERKFLKDITDYEDVPALVNAKSFKRGSDREKFLAELDETAERAATAFVIPFAKIDADDKKRDYLAELEVLLQEIFFCFATVDGDDFERGGRRGEILTEEIGALGASFGALFSGKWEALVKAHEESDL